MIVTSYEMKKILDNKIKTREGRKHPLQSLWLLKTTTNVGQIASNQLLLSAADCVERGLVKRGGEVAKSVHGVGGSCALMRRRRVKKCGMSFKGLRGSEPPFTTKFLSRIFRDYYGVKLYENCSVT